MFWRKYVKNEKGQSLVLVALSIAVLIGLAGIVVDGGKLFTTKSELQKAVDAGALAGATMLIENMKEEQPLNYVFANNEAVDVAEQNYGEDYFQAITIVDDPTFPDNVIEVRGNNEIPTTLMRVLGIMDDSSVRAVAQAEAISEIIVLGLGDVLPLGITPQDYSNVTQLSKPPGNSDHGNFGWLDFKPVDDGNPPNGEVERYEHYLLDGAPAPLTEGDMIAGFKGNKINAGDAMDILKTYIDRIVVLPIVDDFTKNGPTIEIVGFAIFKITDVIKAGSLHIVEGEFIDVYEDGEIDFVNTFPEYTEYKARLIQ